MVSQQSICVLIRCNSLEMVPALLEHLNIRHVALASHSCGAIYLLNTVLHLRHYLHPRKPYAAMIGT